MTIEGSCYTRIFRYISKAYFQGLYPVNHACSNPEIVLTYTRLITQQIYSSHLRVYSCFQGLTSRDYMSLDSHITIKKPWKTFLDPGNSTACWFQGLNTIWGFLNKSVLVHSMSLVYPLKSFISLIRADLISSAVTLWFVDTMGFGSPTSCPTWWVMYEYASTKLAWLVKNISVLGVSSLFDKLEVRWASLFHIYHMISKKSYHTYDQELTVWDRVMKVLVMRQPWIYDYSHHMALNTLKTECCVCSSIYTQFDNSSALTVEFHTH